MNNINIIIWNINIINDINYNLYKSNKYKIITNLIINLNVEIISQTFNKNN